LEIQVMEARKKVLGVEHLDTLLGIGNLASTLRGRRRWSEAEALEIQVMEASKKVLGMEHSGTLTGNGNLASTLRGQERWSEAEELEIQVMEARKRVLGWNIQTRCLVSETLPRDSTIRVGGVRPRSWRFK